ncbi:hypothetical protein C0Q70_02062 [Pomacea canaliculata]|uniref:Uncharacterized protein n=1 Tax=Pomacea canaliculata TaxID=400727 RepID=A0A2T7Q185_POMCA|nr:hypothetical protein C0Q70_02062 [Pomacea canaliculata]
MLASEDCVWQRHERERTVMRLKQNRKVYGLKERYRVAVNWEKGHHQDSWLLRHNIRLLPWVQKDENILWISRGNQICKFHVKSSGHLREYQIGPLRGLEADVTRFVVKNGLVVSGCRGGGVCAWEATSCVLLLRHSYLHRSDTQCVDMVDDLLISGSKDKTVKFTPMFRKDLTVVKSFKIGDRVWSLSVSPDKKTLAVGGACHNNPPVSLIDLSSGFLLGHLGDGHKRGAGVMDMAFESPNILLTGGHDTYLRMWDLRTHTCVQLWEDPFDSAVYCLQTDGQNTVITGTARHGLVRLWDKRQKDHIQTIVNMLLGQAYYTGNQSSPVYSMASDVHRLYVALDMGLNMMDFSVR